MTPSDARVGDYELVSMLGKGRCGEVWKARDARAGREVAVRIPPHDFSERAMRRARDVVALNHPNICAVYQVGPNYLAMELVEGPTLTKPLDEARALLISKQISEGLAAGHRAGICHGDLRPGHIRIQPDGSVKLMDFGLGKAEGADAPTLTMREMGSGCEEADRQALDAIMERELGLVSASRSWGPFQLLERVGGGSFGEVYRALDRKLDREVAVKLLRASANDEEDYNAMVREARVIAKVRHPNVVSVYGVERYDGRVGFWSDFVNGKTLADLLALQGPFGAREAAAIGIEVCRALSAMHGAGLLHRDIKASNVMREQGGRILLMDFGLSTELAGDGRIGGTPQYMAPEIFKGAAPSVATDIYAMGVLLFLLSTGRYPAGRRLIDERPDLPETFSRVVETALDTNPSRRYRSAGEMLGALSDTVGGSQIIGVQPVRKAGWKRSWAVAVAVVVLANLSAIGYRVLARGGHGVVVSGGAGADQDYVAADALLQREDKPGNIDKAIALYEKAIRADRKFALAHSGLARACLLKNRSAHSPEFLDKAASEGKTALEMNGSLAPVHTTMGMIYTAMNRYDLAVNEMQEAIRLDETSAEAYAALAKLYTAQRRTDEVVPNFRKAIDLAPDDWRWPNQLGIYYLSAGKNGDAVEQFRRVVKLTPDNTYGLVNLGIAYRRQEKFGEAEAALKQALKLDPRFTLALNTYGNLLLNQGKYTEASRVYGQAAVLAPDDYLIRANLASAYQWSGENRQARAEYRAAIALAEKLRAKEPGDPALLASLGAYYGAVGNEEKAVPLLRKALALSPDNPTILVRVGEGFELSGHRKEAVEAIGKALALGYSTRYIEQSPELADLRKDPKFLALKPPVR